MLANVPFIWNPYTCVVKEINGLILLATVLLSGLVLMGQLRNSSAVISENRISTAHRVINTPHVVDARKDQKLKQPKQVVRRSNRNYFNSKL
jgi:hypothetical protein